MKNEYIEKDFDVAIIASIIENKVLVILDSNLSANRRKRIMKKFEKDLFDFCSFITGENIDFSNLDRFISIIKKLIIEQYPNMEYKLYSDVYEKFTDDDIINAISKYRNKYGDFIKIKSIKKYKTKTLKI